MFDLDLDRVSDLGLPMAAQVCSYLTQRKAGLADNCFFQAEDCIRDGHVTGVQTCALPICPIGAVLIVDDQARSISSFDVTLDDLRAIAAMPQGAMAVGTTGTVMLLSGGDWQPYARGIEEDLNGIVVFGLQSAWAVGSQGISYRLEVAGWRPVKTGVDITLRAIAGPNVQTAVAVGDGGTILALSGLTWSKVESGTDASLRAVAIMGATAWAVGADGVVIAVEQALVSPAI